MTRRTRLGSAVALIGAASMAALALSTPATAAATTTIALYNMSEASSSQVLVDSSGNGFNGTIGSVVVHPATFSGATGHRFTFIQPNQPPANPQRLDQVPDNATLRPGTSDFAVTVRYRTTQNFGNILQKGQSGGNKGYWKFQQPQGIVSCLFRGADGSKSVNSGVALNDGQWHTVRCERTATKVVMTIDGTKKRTGNGATGAITNTAAMTIGGKVSCDQVNVTCDYFVGDIDYVRIEKG